MLKSKRNQLQCNEVEDAIIGIVYFVINLNMGVLIWMYASSTVMLEKAGRKFRFLC